MPVPVLPAVALGAPAVPVPVLPAVALGAPAVPDPVLPAVALAPPAVPVPGVPALAGAPGVVGSDEQAATSSAKVRPVNDNHDGFTPHDARLSGI